MIFEPGSGDNGVPSADSRLLADGIVECVNAGAEVINMSVAGAPSATTDRRLADALTYAMHRRVLVVAAAGNDGTFRELPPSPAILALSRSSHVTEKGAPYRPRTSRAPIGRRGIGAPGDRITGLDLDGGTIVRSRDERRRTVCDRRNCAVAFAVAHNTAHRGACGAPSRQWTRTAVADAAITQCVRRDGGAHIDLRSQRTCPTRRRL